MHIKKYSNFSLLSSGWKWEKSMLSISSFLEEYKEVD